MEHQQRIDELKRHIMDEELKFLNEYTAGTGRKTLIMCAEKNPDTCHRKYFVGRALEEAGYRVKHL